MKNNILTKIYNKISLSLNGNSNRISSTRIQAYLIAFSILMMNIVFLLIEIIQFGNALYHHKDYVISNEMIIIFGMILSHHLAILFSRTKSTIESENVKELEQPEITNDENIN